MSYQWATELIGKPYRLGADGPDYYDCWGLVKWVYRERLGIDLLPYNKGVAGSIKVFAGQFALGILSGQWEETAEPTDLAAVALSRNRLIHHCGVFLDVDGGKVLHCDHPHGVTAEPLNRMAARGWRRIEFFKWQP